MPITHRRAVGNPHRIVIELDTNLPNESRTLEESFRSICPSGSKCGEEIQHLTCVAQDGVAHHIDA
jgi:hypothetical protein